MRLKGSAACSHVAVLYLVWLSANISEVLFRQVAFGSLIAIIDIEMRRSSARTAQL